MQSARPSTQGVAPEPRGLLEKGRGDKQQVSESRKTVKPGPRVHWADEVRGGVNREMILAEKQKKEASECQAIAERKSQRSVADSRGYDVEFARRIMKLGEAARVREMEAKKEVVEKDVREWELVGEEEWEVI